MTGEITVKQDSVWVRYRYRRENGEIRQAVEYFYGDASSTLRRAEEFVSTHDLESWEIVRIRKTEEVIKRNG